MTTFAGPFDSTNMAQAQWEEVESKLWTDGVIAGARNQFATTTTTGLGLSVNTGDAILDGFRFYADAATALTCAAADPSLPRIDLVVLRIDESAHTATIAIKTGTPAGSPTAPTATKTVGGTYELGISQARVNAGATSITSLTDVRTYTTPGNAVNKTGDTMTGALSGTSATFTGPVSASSVTANPVNNLDPVVTINSPGTDFVLRWNGTTMELADTTNGHTLMIWYSAGVGSVGVGTNDDGTLRQSQTFTGTTDPAGRTGVTVREGDVWISG